MKHWLWYKTDGEIGGEIVRRDGWGVEDLNDSESTDPTVIDLRATYTVMSGFTGFISFTCGDGDGLCDCACQKVSDERVNLSGPALETKPTFVIKVDSVTMDNKGTIDKTPSVSVDIHLEGTVPDGVVVCLANAGRVDMLETSPQFLTFSSNVTNTIAITAPTAGATGVVSLVPQNLKDARQGHFSIRGWQTA